jgi:citrate lyase beta subunit
MNLSIPENEKHIIFQHLAEANTSFNNIYKGEPDSRQAVHSVYGGAHLFKADSLAKMGGLALNHLITYAPDFVSFASILKLKGYEQLPQKKEEIKRLIQEIENLSSKELKKHPAWLAYTVYNKVIEKLKTEAVEDFRIDFEDGFGNRPDEEEDATAINAASEVAKAMKQNTLPPFIGIRIKPFEEALKKRSVRTLDLFLTHLLTQTNGKLPNNFVVTLPKVTLAEQVSALKDFFEILELHLHLKPGQLKMEIMVETSQAILNSDGKNPLRLFVSAAEGCCVGAHFGTYDYTASGNIIARYQSMDHSICDFAHYTMKAALGGTGIFLSDGATNVMPIGKYKGTDLTDEQIQENTRLVHQAWQLQFSHIRHSLWKGLYQGWDLHPSQFPIRYAAVYSFFLEDYQATAARLKNFMDRAAQATLSGDVFDDAATGQGLLNYFIRAFNSAAIGENEVTESGLSMEEIRTRSFYKILEGRKSRNSQLTTHNSQPGTHN